MTCLLRVLIDFLIVELVESNVILWRRFVVCQFLDNEISVACRVVAMST